MNSIERVRAAIERGPVDRIPKGEFLVEKGFIEEFMRMTGDLGTHNSLDEAVEIEFYRRLKLDLVCIHANKLITNHMVSSNKSSHIEHWKNEKFFIFSVIDGAFQTLMCQRGFLGYLKEIAQQPDRAVEEMKRLSQKLVPQIEQIISSGVHGIIIADDIAYDQGTYVSPTFIRQYLLPCWQEQVHAVRELGVPIFFHSDGNINTILPTIMEAGFDGLQCIEPAAGMDIGEVKGKLGKDLCIMGNIDPALLYPGKNSGTSANSGSLRQPHRDRFPELARAVKDLISAAAPGGGFIFGTCSGLHSALSPEKVLFMYELADKVGARREVRQSTSSKKLTGANSSRAHAHPNGTNP
jgi:uroporphyrinogen decarboxylase